MVGGQNFGEKSRTFFFTRVSHSCVLGSCCAPKHHLYNAVDFYCFLIVAWMEFRLFLHLVAYVLTNTPINWVSCSGYRMPNGPILFSAGFFFSCYFLYCCTKYLKGEKNTCGIPWQSWTTVALVENLGWSISQLREIAHVVKRIIVC